MKNLFILLLVCASTVAQAVNVTQLGTSQKLSSANAASATASAFSSQRAINVFGSFDGIERKNHLIWIEDHRYSYSTGTVVYFSRLQTGSVSRIPSAAIVSAYAERKPGSQNELLIKTIWVDYPKGENQSNTDEIDQKRLLFSKRY